MFAFLTILILTFTFCINYFFNSSQKLKFTLGDISVLKTSCCETNTFEDLCYELTLSDIYVVPRYLLSQHPLAMYGIFSFLDVQSKTVCSKTFLKVGTNENGSACGRWLSIGI
jgi:hypothetical protein